MLTENGLTPGASGCPAPEWETARMESTAILDALMANGCRFVVVGSTARLLCGETVVPNDLDIVVDASAEQRPLLRRALISVHAHVRTRHGLEPLSTTTRLPWEWSFSAVTPVGEVDVVVRSSDGSTFDDQRRQAVSVQLGPLGSVWCHPTRWAA
jgi:hypothetical protein